MNPEQYTFCPMLAFTFRWSTEAHIHVDVLESGEYYGWVSRDDRTSLVFPSVAQAARRWAGWMK